jgi:hypothetical protein
MKTQHGDNPLIDDIRMYLAVAQFVRDYIAAAFQGDEASVLLAAGLLERMAITVAGAIQRAPFEVRLGHAQPDPGKVAGTTPEDARTVPPKGGARCVVVRFARGVT